MTLKALPPPSLELNFRHCEYKPFKTTPISQNRDYNLLRYNVAPLAVPYVVLRIPFTC